MRTVLALLRKDFLLFARDRTDLVVTFLVPIVLIYIFGLVFGVSRESHGGGLGSSWQSRIPLAVVTHTNDPVVVRIIEALQREKTFRVVMTEKNAAGVDQPLTDARVRALMRDNQFRFAVIFPPDASSETAFGLKLTFLNNPVNDLENGIVTGVLEKTIYSTAPVAMIQSLRERAAGFVGQARTDQFYHTLASAIADTFGGDAATIYQQIKTGDLTALPSAVESKDKNAGASSSDFLSRIVRIDSEQVAGKEVKSQMATRLVGGWAMMFLLFSVSGSAASLFNEKKAGLFLRLLSMPVRRSHLLWSKYLYGMALGLFQLTIMFVAGHFLYGIDITTHFGNLLLACLAASTACTAFGMLLASVAPSPQAASGLATLLILTMSAIGGAWFPTSLMPEFIQHLAKLTLVYWSIEGFQQVLWNGATLRELLPTLGILLGLAAVVNTFSLWRFTRGNLFD